MTTMSHTPFCRRKLYLSALALIGSLTLTSVPSMALADNGIYRERADIEVPQRGLSMEQVRAKFGEAQHVDPAVGEPPITRWQYQGFTVYFEHRHVIHSVITL